MSKRNFWRGMGVGFLLAILFGCGTPKNEPLVALPACPSAPANPPSINRFYETQKPCRPGKGQRVLVYLENDGVKGSRTATCNAIGGTPVTSDQPGWDACDYVNVDSYVTVVGIASGTTT